MQPKMNKTAIKINIGRSIKIIMGLSKVDGDITMETDMGIGLINGKDPAMDLGTCSINGKDPAIDLDIDGEIEAAASPLLDVMHLNPSALLYLY